MKIGLRLFLSSSAFSIAIAIAYWITSREAVGAVLLGFMAFGTSFVATYMIVAEREADLWSDRRDATMAQAAGEVVGTYTTRSPLPAAAAFALTCIVLGIVVSPVLAVCGVVALLILGAFFIVQS